MSANVENGIFRKTPWHQLGTVVGDTFDWEQAERDMQPVTLEVQKVAMSDLVLAYSKFATEQYAAVRSDGTVLYVGHGEQWTPFQAKDAYEFGEAIRGEAGGRLESLGTLNGGTQYFMTYDLGEFHIGDYLVKDYLSVNGSFDGSWKLQSLSSAIVEVCANTVSMAKAAGISHYSYKHTSGIFDRVAEAIKAIQRHDVNRQSMKAAGTKLLSTKVGNEQYRSMLDKLFPIADVSTKTQNTNTVARESVNALYTATATEVDVVQGVENTAWAFVQSVNTYENWGQPIRKQKGVGDASTRARRQIDALVSGRQPLTDEALELVLA